ncbi:hypothetical protein TeGR_g773, partial [Tetraparma gracilis]
TGMSAAEMRKMEQMMGGGGGGGGMGGMGGMGMSAAEMRKMEQMMGGGGGGGMADMERMFGAMGGGGFGAAYSDSESGSSDGEGEAGLVTAEMISGLSMEDVAMVAMMEIEAGRPVPPAVAMRLGPDVLGEIEREVAGGGKGKNTAKNKKRREKEKMKKKAAKNKFVNKAAGQGGGAAADKENGGGGPGGVGAADGKGGGGKKLSDISQYSPGMRVFVSRVGCAGTVAHVGPVHYAKGDWVGVALEEGRGKNDGSVKGERYFDCRQGFGMLVRPNECEEA